MVPQTPRGSLLPDSCLSPFLQRLLECVPTLTVVDMSWYGTAMLQRLAIIDPVLKTSLPDGFPSQTFVEEPSWPLRDQSLYAIVKARSQGEQVLVCCLNSA
jgi:hypothetical protein